MEGETPAVGAKGEVADVHLNCGELFGRAASGGDGVDVRDPVFVVRLVDACREEIKARTIVRPAGLAFIVVAARELNGLGPFIGPCGYLDDPDVLVTFGIEITLIVVAIYGAADDVDVGLMVVVQMCVFG